MTRAWLLMVAIAPVACGGAADHSTVTRLGDTIRVSNIQPRHRDTASLVLTQTFGSFDGPETEQFGAIQAFAVAEDDGIYVFDRDAGLKLFSADGRFERLAARLGKGPGEVMCPDGVASWHGLVATDDLCTQRITLFRDSAAPVTIPRPDGHVRYGEDGLFFDVEGNLWIGLMPYAPRGGNHAYPRPVAARVAEDGTYRDTVYAPKRYVERCPASEEGLHRAGFYDDNREPFYPKVKWALGEDGRLAFGCPRKFELDVLDPAGDVVRISKPWRPIEVSNTERSFYERWVPQLGAIARQRPAYARIVLARDGRIWVWPEQPSEPAPFEEDDREFTGLDHGWSIAEHGAFEVFTADGHWLGAVGLPRSVHYSGYPTTPPIVIRGDTVWAVMRDSLDVEYIGRFQVVWPD